MNFDCESYEKFDNLLTEIEKDLQEIQTRLNYPEEKIRSYCDRIRNQIDLNTENLIEKLNAYRDRLLNELTIYEKNCLENLDRIERKDIFLKLLSENTRKVEYYYKYLNNCRIDEESVKSMMEQAKLQEYKLKNNTQILNALIFGKNFITYEEPSKQLDQNFLGRFNYEDLSHMNDITDIDRIANSQIEMTLQYQDKIIDFALSIQDRFLVVIGQCLKMIDDQSNDIVDIRFDSTVDFVSHNLRDSILVQHRRCLWRNDRREISQAFTLSVYDFNLNLKEEIVIETKIQNCVTNENNIFVQCEKTNTVSVYTWDLVKIMTIGQNLYADRAYFFRDFVLEAVKYDRMYLRKRTADEEGDYWVRVVSLSSGDLLHEFYLNCRFEIFFIDALSRSIVVDPVFSILRIYDKPNSKSNQADLLLERDIDLRNCSGFKMTLDGKFFFIRDKKYIEYYQFSAF
ncbi:hypothetical protein BpHYR1_021425 [Brachionus plicatilis]|uniref:Uncharacterized protein n=1 Tax=Brachionus plicatilis TaxID=10195 RepID=A0A3M7PUK7_BRAPC|nr:hypothetical protein BpHYR1_021425 [Brachionus plicatilis]